MSGSDPSGEKVLQIDCFKSLAVGNPYRIARSRTNDQNRWNRDHRSNACRIINRPAIKNDSGAILLAVNWQQNGNHARAT